MEPDIIDVDRKGAIALYVVLYNTIDYTKFVEGEGLRLLYLNNQFSSISEFTSLYTNTRSSSSSFSHSFIHPS